MPTTKYLAEGTSLQAVADAIRTKTGDSGQLTFPAGFVDAIGSISGGGSGSGSTVKVIHGYGAYGSVQVNGWSVSDLSIDPSNGQYIVGCVNFLDEFYPIAFIFDGSNQLYGTMGSNFPEETILFIFNVTKDVITGAISKVEHSNVVYYSGGEQAEFEGYDDIYDWYIVSIQA